MHRATGSYHMATNINTLLRAAAAADTEALRSRLTGDVITAADARYDSARATQNQKFDRRPALIVRARGAADVAESVKFARAQGLDLAVKAGGHSLSGQCVVDDALVVDLSGMRGISIDQRKKTARVQGGATSGDLAGPAHALPEV